MKQHGPHKRQQNGPNGERKFKKAVIVSNPDVVYECKPGMVVMHEVEVKNDTPKPWRKGFVLGMEKTDGVPIETVERLIDKGVEP